MPAYRIYEGQLHFLTSTVVDWIDLFTRFSYAEIVIESLAYCQANKGLRVHGYVIMPSHIHMIVSHISDGLSSTIRDFKQFTSRAIVQAIREEPESRRDWLLKHFSEAAASNPKVRHAQLWQEGNHAKVCTDYPFTLQKLTYIHENPVKARIVCEAHHYVWSSAQDYVGIPGPLPVSLLW
ncbi:MAG: transposase [Bacteroidia bacterium]